MRNGRKEEKRRPLRHVQDFDEMFNEDAAGDGVRATSSREGRSSTASP